MTKLFILFVAIIALLPFLLGDQVNLIKSRSGDSVRLSETMVNEVSGLLRCKDSNLIFYGKKGEYAWMIEGTLFSVQPAPDPIYRPDTLMLYIGSRGEELIVNTSGSVQTVLRANNTIPSAREFAEFVGVCIIGTPIQIIEDPKDLEEDAITAKEKESFLVTKPIYGLDDHGKYRLVFFALTTDGSLTRVTVVGTAQPITVETIERSIVARPRSFKTWAETFPDRAIRSDR